MATGKRQERERMEVPATQQRTLPGSFRAMHVMPRVSDLIDSNTASSDRRSLRSNVLFSRYPDLETYLDVQFRLIREDFYGPLRESIGKFCSESAQVPPRPNEARQQLFQSYKNVTFIVNSFLGEKTAPDHPKYWQRYVIRCPSIAGFDWKGSKRLMHGSLVCLWNAKERIIILGRVAKSDREELEKGLLTIAVESLPDGIPQDFQQKNYTLLECLNFFEPYRAVMEAYQEMTEGNMPFKKLLLGWTTRPGSPGYLEVGDNNGVGLYNIPLPAGGVAVIKNVLDLKRWPSKEVLGLNEIQRKALFAAATHRLALIQGPPGTGKTFVGRRIIQMLLANKQLWGRTDEDHRRDNRGLFDIQPQYGTKAHEFWKKHGAKWTDKRCPIVVICLTNQALDQFLEGMLDFTKRMIRIGGQCQSNVLEGYTMKNVKNKAIEEEDKYFETAFFYRSKNRMCSVTKSMDQSVDLIRKRNPTQIKSESRMVSAYREQIEEFNLTKAEAEEALCRGAEVIGLTTTGAARRRLLLQILKPKILIVEEAAQVLEPHIVACIPSSCEHLIMIGDHKQLRPTVSSQLLRVDYSLDVSLFERLTSGGFPTIMLNVQHRMRPEIARLIDPAVYPNLKNHATVYHKPKVPSLAQNVFFWNHNHLEEQEECGPSYLNRAEALMALRLAHFLCGQGIQQDQITILVTYAAQVKTMTDVRQAEGILSSLDRVHITTVDNYQGEENDVVILSLVRNNGDGNVGFLKIPNRVCVALTRARQGLFMLGNLELLAESGSKSWIHVKSVLSQNGQFGHLLQLQCDNHPEQFVMVETSEEFPVTGNVCSLQCGAHMLDSPGCGHPCPLPCRPAGQCDHKFAICKVEVPVRLLCGHDTVVPCNWTTNGKWEEQRVTSTCPFLVRMPPDHVFKKCGHVAVVPCSMRLPLCSNPKGREDLEDFWPECQEPCLAPLPGCGHPCPGRCGDCGMSGIHASSRCERICRRPLPCGHPCPLMCWQVCPPCEELSGQYCPHMDCDMTCGQKCPKCPKRCPRSCLHFQCEHPLDIPCQREPCYDEPCRKILPGCGHRCPGLCGEVCPGSCLTCDLFPGTDWTRDWIMFLPAGGHSVPPTCRKVAKNFDRYAKAFDEDLESANLAYLADGVLWGGAIRRFATHGPAGLLRATWRVRPVIVISSSRPVAQRSDGFREMGVPLCAHCGTREGKLKRCGRCKSVSYCSVECQRADWTNHKSSCSKTLEKDD